jgi:type VI secretion system protein ImpA
MSFDVNALLEPCSEGAPCGANLEYDPDFMELETAAQGKPEQQFGDTIVPAEEPDWETVGRGAAALASRTKDLRVAFLLTRAHLHTEGLRGLVDGLELVRAYLRDFWLTLHPELDPDDDNDPTLRINVIESFAGQGVIIARLRNGPLLSSRITGPVSIRDLAIFTGKELPPEGMPAPKFGDLESIFLENHPEQIRELTDLAARGSACVKEIEAIVAQQASGGQSVDLSRLTAIFREIGALLSPWLERLQDMADEGTEEAGQGTEAGPLAAEDGAPVQAVPRNARKGINSREDVIRAIEEVCRYYEQHEPSSPVPILLNRAKRWVKKDFLSLIQEIAPEGMTEVGKLVGPID